MRNGNYPRYLANFNSSAHTGDKYSQLLCQRDRHLSLVLAEVLTDVILADASDYGVGLAVGKIFASYRPCAQRWEQLQYPNTRWLTCGTEGTVGQPSRTVHINLLNGKLLVAGQPLRGLLRDVRECFRYVCTCYSFINKHS